MAKTSFANQSRKAFMKVWRLSGKPTLKMIESISTWTLPVGVTYNSHFDSFVDGSGETVSVDWSTQPGTTVEFLPAKATSNITLGVPGISSVEYTNVTLLWSSTVEAKLRACWGVVIGSNLYRVQNVELNPLGALTPSDMRVSLSEGE